MIDKLAIVFTVFDGYEDLWDDAIRLIKKNWIDHPPIYVFTNEIVKKWEDVKCIPVGSDAEWSKKVQKACEIVKEDYFVMLLEDFYVGSAVNNDDVQELLTFIIQNSIGYCKLCDNNRIIQKHKKKFMNSKYDVIYADEDYGISLQAAIWEKNFLLKTIGENNYNAWVFELNQVVISRNAPHIILRNAIEDQRNILNIKHGALQGKMLPHTVKYFEDIDDALSTKREIMCLREYIKYYIKQLGKDIVPKPAVKLTKKVAKKVGYTFVEEQWLQEGK